MADASRDRSGEVVQLVGFWLSGEEYALEITQVQEIRRVPEITRVPRAPDFVTGVMNLRGRIIPVIDLKKRFRLEETGERSSANRIVVVEVDDSTAGIFVDAMSEVVTIGVEDIEPPPQATAGGIEPIYVRGVGKLGERLLIILDLNKILSPEDWAQTEAMSPIRTV
ncbi:MAG: chemotaxis protein CheW [bacterium]